MSLNILECTDVVFSISKTQSIFLISLFNHKTSTKEIVLSTSLESLSLGSSDDVINRRLFPSKNLF